MKNGSSGFTLIELLVSVSIVGILAALAIPHYAAYRSSAFDSTARNDLRTVATAEEAYFIDYEAYVDCTEADCSAVLPGVGLMSRGVRLQVTATTTGFSGTSTHPQGSGMVCRWDKSLGGLVGCI